MKSLFNKSVDSFLPYNPLIVGDIVLVKFISNNPDYYNLYIDTVKNINTNSKGYKVCRLQSFNYDIELLDKNSATGRVSNAIAYHYYSISDNEDDEKSYYTVTQVYNIEGARKELLALKQLIGSKYVFSLDAYQKYIKFSEKLIEMLELQINRE